MRLIEAVMVVELLNGAGCLGDTLATYSIGTLFPPRMVVYGG